MASIGSIKDKYPSMFYNETKFVRRSQQLCARYMTLHELLHLYDIQRQSSSEKSVTHLYSTSSHTLIRK